METLTRSQCVARSRAVDRVQRKSRILGSGRGTRRWENMGSDADEMFPSKSFAWLTLNGLFATARKMFSVDGHHDLVSSQRPALTLRQLAVQEHGEKYLVMRMLFWVINFGADGVIIINLEIWASL